MMSFDYLFEVRSPSELSDSATESFKELIKKGGQVDVARLPELVLGASKLAFARQGPLLVGVGGIKRPRPAYQIRVFEKAGVADPGRYPFELGWLFVEEDHRGKGLSLKLVDALCASVESAGKYATSHISNVMMHRTLERAGFQRVGSVFAGRRSQKDLLLFTKEPS